MDALSSPPFNTAMQVLQKLKHPVKGATPFSQMDSFRPCGHHVRAMLMALSGTLAAGMALGNASAAMPSIERRFWRDEPSSPPENRWIPDSLFLGATVGALVSGILLHLAGHRRTLLLSSGGLTSFWVSLMLANRVSMIVVSRVAIGICVGVMTNCVCLYVTDVAPPAKRTLYGGLVEVSTSVGMLCAYAMAGFAWQQQAVGCAMASVPMLALQRYVIENPRWLMSKHLSLDADTSVMRLYGLDPPPDLRERKKKGAEERKPASTSSRLWPSDVRVVSTCLLLYLLQNISGAQMCLLRAVQVMSNVVVEVPPQFLAVVLVFSHLACTTLATALTPLTNRRTQLGISAFLVAVTLFIFRPLDHLTFTHWSVTEQSGKTSWRAAISIGMLVVAYSVGVCHLPTLLTGELMPSRIRLLGSSIAWSSRWLLAFHVLYFDIDVLTAFQQKGPLLALSLTVAVVAATTIYLIPETEGRSLEQIEHD
ncbi:facilitated trehalose transporter Tret1-like [Rhipicephalus microplus]|uniref:facilitated trehalose transporter Tret1-like n=1 Tax=Rhipicephalus microplus TaxID=6941 RepID=UPI003F6BCD4C